MEWVYILILFTISFLKIVILNNCDSVTREIKVILKNIIKRHNEEYLQVYQYQDLEVVFLKLQWALCIGKYSLCQALKKTEQNKQAKKKIFFEEFTI